MAGQILKTLLFSSGHIKIVTGYEYIAVEIILS